MDLVKRYDSGYSSIYDRYRRDPEVALGPDQVFPHPGNKNSWLQRMCRLQHWKKTSGPTWAYEPESDRNKIRGTTLSFTLGTLIISQIIKE